MSSHVVPVNGPKQEEIPEPQPELTAADRCDKEDCNARAYVRASFIEGDLYFCGHHAKELREKVEPRTILWLDETHFLEEEEKQRGLMSPAEIAAEEARSNRGRETKR